MSPTLQSRTVCAKRESTIVPFRESVKFSPRRRGCNRPAYGRSVLKNNHSAVIFSSSPSSNQRQPIRLLEGAYRAFASEISLPDPDRIAWSDQELGVERIGRFGRAFFAVNENNFLVSAISKTPRLGDER
jgi:hypothetical protein